MAAKFGFGLILSLFLTATSHAAAPIHDGLIDGTNLKRVTLDSVLASVRPGGVLIVSEQHGNAFHHARQREALKALHQAGACTVSVGLEFFAWPFQPAIDHYAAGTLGEKDFLQAIEWGGNSYDDYREQAQFPKISGGRLIGLNARRSLTSAIAKRGLDGLTPAEKAEMPPQFELGNANYRERFDLIMGGHMPPEAADRYFAAQSTWDESMSWVSAEFLKANPSHCLVIIVGDFHAQWGGGLPDRLRARGVSNVTVISQIESTDFDDVELKSELRPHPKYGSRADAIWLSETPAPPPPDGTLPGRTGRPAR